MALSQKLIAAPVEWFPDWSGQAAAIIASGPSVKGQNLAALQGRMKVLAIKANVSLCKWADVVYGCDAPWWRHERGLPKFGGIKICWSGSGLQEFSDIRRIDIEKLNDRLLLDKPGTIGSGGSSGFQAVNLAVQFGATRLLLIGFDMDARNANPHWYGRNQWMGASNPDRSTYKRWIASFNAIAPELERLGVKVINTSRDSPLNCFPKRTIEEALAEWA